MVYIDSFSRRKNTDALGWAIPQILVQTPTERALLIGPGETKVVESLQEKRGGAHYAATVEFLVNHGYMLNGLSIRLQNTPFQKSTIMAPIKNINR